MAGLMYRGSSLPPQVSQAAQNYLNYQKAIQNKLPLAVEGSGIPDSVRKAAQAALERGALSAPQAAEAAAPAVGRGILGNVARAAGGPVTAGLMALEPTMMGDGELSPEQREAQNPGQAADAQAYAQRVQENAVQAAQPPLQGQGLLTAGVQPPQPEPDMPPQQSPMDIQPQAAEEAPQVQAQEQQREVEAGRQTIEQGVTKGLQTGEVKVSELAQGIVDADQQRAGTQLTPEEKTKAVEAEVQAMKSMGPSDMARYVSYAIVAGGLIASVLDKSGKTGQMFHESYNKQLDRNLAAGKMAAEQRLAWNKEQREERKVDINEKDVSSKIDDRSAGQKARDRELSQGDTRLEQGAAGLDLKRDLGQANIAVAREGNAIKSQGLLQRANQFDQRLALDKEALGAKTGESAADRAARLKIADDKLAAAQAKAEKDNAKGVPMSFKDAQGATKNFYDAQGLTASKEVIDAAAARLPTIQKNYPQLNLVNQIRLVEKELGSNLEREGRTFRDDKVKIKKIKESK